MHSFSDMARLLNVSTVNLSRLQKRFELPPFEGQGYSDVYLILLRKLTALRTFGVTEDTQLNLCSLEKKLMRCCTQILFIALALGGAPRGC
jgi:hypothetical protein